jgi:hypothetical protein
MRFICSELDENRFFSQPDEIAAGLKQLAEMSDDDRAAMGTRGHTLVATKMGTRGHTLVATKFSWPRIGKQMRAVYEWVLGSGAPPETIRLD